MGKTNGKRKTANSEESIPTHGYRSYTRFFFFLVSFTQLKFQFQENPNIPLHHTPGLPKPPNERNSFINCWFRVWGMFQGYVGKFLDQCKSFRKTNGKWKTHETNQTKTMMRVTTPKKTQQRSQQTRVIQKNGNKTLKKCRNPTITTEIHQAFLA